MGSKPAVRAQTEINLAGGESTKLGTLLLPLLLLVVVVSSSGNLSNTSANVFVHVCGVALCKGMLKLVFLGLCPGPLYYPESVRFCMH